jgi:hypothetical protein
MYVDHLLNIALKYVMIAAFHVYNLHLYHHSALYEVCSWQNIIKLTSKQLSSENVWETLKFLLKKNRTLYFKCEHQIFKHPNILLVYRQILEI